MRFAAILLLLLTACAAPGRGPVDGFRRDGAPIASAALFEPQRFLGDWVVVAETPGPEARCPAEVTWARSGPGYTRARCPGAAEVRALSGPGRFTGSGAAPIWVLWVDSGYRTAVLGTPDGSFARILNRDPVIPADRYAAARELLDFNGYDLRALRRRDN